MAIRGVTTNTMDGASDGKSSSNTKGKHWKHALFPNPVGRMAKISLWFSIPFTTYSGIKEIVPNANRINTGLLIRAIQSTRQLTCNCSGLAQGNPNCWNTLVTVEIFSIVHVQIAKRGNEVRVSDISA